MRHRRQVEILDKPPVKEDKGLTWPDWPNKLRTSSSQEEGCERHWNVLTKGFVGDDQGRVQAVKYCLVQWDKDAQGRWQMSEVPGSEAEFKADLVLLAMGFVHPVHAGMIEVLKAETGLELDPRGNVKVTTEGVGAYQTSVPGVFGAGDMRRGQSLVVCAYSTQTGQPFHRKLDTCSAANWTAVPGQTGPSERSAARG